MDDWVYTFLFSMFPWIELRGSIPYGVLKAGLNPILVFAVAVFANCLVIYPSFIFLDYAFHIMEKTPLKKSIDKTHKKAKPYVDRYGFLGLTLFVAVPLPFTGAYSGALAAHIFGIKGFKAFCSIAAGVVIAGILVTLISLFFSESMGFLLKTI